MAVITNVGPVHVELLGSVEAIAAAKAEVLDGAAGRRAPRSSRSRPASWSRTWSERRGCSASAPAATSRRSSSGSAEGVTEALIATPAGRARRFHFPFAEAHNLTNALAAVAAGVALGAPLAEMADRAASIGFSRFRGERLELGDGIVLVNDCYNANPVSMRAALDHLAHARRRSARIAVLGEMAELGPGAAGLPPRGRRARPRAPGSTCWSASASRPATTAPTSWSARPEEAAELLAARLEPGDAVLVKGSRSAGLEAVAETELDGAA